jgi:uncharacterized damage-inducible protein DinB
MTNREFFLARLEVEHAAFVRVFRALPADKLDYRPHSRSRSAGELLALLVYEKQSEIELCEKGVVHWSEPPGFGKLDDMVSDYEQHHARVVTLLRQLDDPAWEKPAKGMVGEEVVLEDTVGGLLWIGLFDAVHHRGQLSVYIRPMGGKVPSIYGPSADDTGT